MHQAGGRVMQRHAIDVTVARLHFDETALQVADTAFDDAHQVAIATLEPPVVAVRVLDALDRPGLWIRQCAHACRQFAAKHVLQAALEAHQPLPTPTQQARAISEIEAGPGLAFSGRQLGEERGLVRAGQPHAAVVQQFQADVGRRLPARAAQAGKAAPECRSPGG
ncbi:hypothetical protein G6F40_015113 [Rhizopus arrhizus]|nr:hypothetical protein G6F40_015113 [Rhizopus arrhizus]